MNSVKFIIAGAAKSGTTSLYEYINQHESVFMPVNKEPRFFCDYPIEKFNFGDTYFHNQIAKTKEQYFDLFKDAPIGAMCGEASTDYLACRGTAQRIADWNKDIKVFIMLRNPVERAYSEYMHSFNAGFQKFSFWESLQLETERREQLYDPIFFHVNRGLYAEPVAEFTQKLQTKIIFFEDFTADPEQVTQSAFDFLGLERQEIDTSKAFNVGTKSYYDTRPLTGEQHEWLINQFASDVKALEIILDVKLEHWLN